MMLILSIWIIFKKDVKFELLKINILKSKSSGNSHPNDSESRGIFESENVLVYTVEKL